MKRQPRAPRTDELASDASVSSEPPRSPRRSPGRSGGGPPARTERRPHRVGGPAGPVGRCRRDRLGARQRPRPRGGARWSISSLALDVGQLAEAARRARHDAGSRGQTDRRCSAGTQPACGRRTRACRLTRPASAPSGDGLGRHVELTSPGPPRSAPASPTASAGRSTESRQVLDQQSQIVDQIRRPAPYPRSGRTQPRQPIFVTTRSIGVVASPSDRARPMTARSTSFQPEQTLIGAKRERICCRFGGSSMASNAIGTLHAIFKQTADWVLSIATIPFRRNRR